MSIRKRALARRALRRRALAIGLAATSMLPVAAHALQVDAIRLLVDQGKYWQAHRRGDLAQQAWEKILRARPDNPDALWGMGMVEADQKHNDRAQSYLAKLRQVAPAYPGIASLASRLGGHTEQERDADEARHLANAGRTGAALERYRAALAAGTTPSPELALEYYQTLGGTPQGWDRARRGLAKLAHDNPSDVRIQLALAQHLTYREQTRRDGIRMLQALAGNVQVGAQAKSSWRQALIWLGARAADTALYTAYLHANSDDAAVSARLEALSQHQRATRAQAAANAATDARGKTLAAAFGALQSGELDVATQRFQTVLAEHPDDPDALGGMGVLRLKQEQFADARELLERASRGPNPERWRSALASATYWALVNDAASARVAGSADGYVRAKDLLERAIRTDPNEITAQNALGDVYVAMGDAKAAEGAYRMVLRRQSDNPDAIRGLVGALAQQGRADEALRYADQLTAQQRERVGGLGALRARVLQSEARAAEARGDLAGARTDLENAQLNGPDSPWIRLDLAHIYMKLGALVNARSVMDGLLASHPDMPDALYAGALLYGELGDWNRSLQTLERIPAPSRTDAMARLQRRAWIHASAERASALVKQGRVADAHALLQHAEPVAGRDPELVGAIASAYADTGDSARALWLMRQSLAQTPPDAGVRLQYAGILLKAQQDVELASVLRQIESMRLTDAQRADFDKLQLAYALRQADSLRVQGDLVNAYNVIAPALAVHPDDPDLQAALARMYTSAGEYVEALKLYEAARLRKPDDVDLMLAAAGTAVSTKQYGYANDAIDRALKLAPNDPRVLAQAGRVYHAQGRDAKAADYFRASLAAQNLRAGGANGPLDMRLVGRDGAQPQGVVEPSRVPVNPFIGKSVVGAPGVGAAAQPVLYAPQQPYGGQPGYPQQGYGPQQYGQHATEQPQDYDPRQSYAQPPDVSQPYAQQPNPQQAYQQAYQQPYAQPYQPSFASQPVRAGAYAQQSATTGRDGSTGGATTSATPARHLTVQEELDQIDQERASTIAAGIEFRNRNGESGLASLTDIEAPVEGRVAAGDGKVVVRATPVTLDAGTPDPSFGVSSRFGAGPAQALVQSLNSGPAIQSQTASGVGLSLGYEMKNLQLDAGTTPLGFRESNIVGGLKYTAGLTDTTTLALNASRRAVTDSLLSYAGAKDGRTGLQWGGVTSSGLRADLTWDDGTNGMYAYGSFAYLDGKNVESNRRGEGGGGVYTRLIKEAGQTLTAGVNASVFGYSRNLRYFTYGQGGYFSPQQYVQLAVPVEWNLKSGKYSFQLKGSIGVQHFREDDSPYFPTDAGLQSGAAAALRKAVAAGLTSQTAAVYPGQSKTGLAYDFLGVAEYQLGPQMFLGGYLGVDNARDYSQYYGGIYIRYTFARIASGAATPPSVTRSPYLPVY